MLSPAITQVSPSFNGKSAAEIEAAEASRKNAAAAWWKGRKRDCMGAVVNDDCRLSTTGPAPPSPRHSDSRPRESDTRRDPFQTNFVADGGTVTAARERLRETET